MALCSINVWTGSPLLSLWIGSRIQGDSSALKMEAVFGVIVCMIGLSILLLGALARLTHQYDELIGNVRPRRQTPWLRAMSGERQTDVTAARQTTAAEYVLIGSVVLAVLTFEVWFFFFSGSSIGGGGGR